MCQCFEVGAPQALVIIQFRTLPTVSNAVWTDCTDCYSWSKSGNLLASGSDDTHLNIHSYQPDSSNSAFKLATTVATGHSANIFSVKFMPHSNDRTLITAAGDNQVRIFDIEYSAGSSVQSAATQHRPTSRPQGFESHGVQYLSETDTNTRVYRSHCDRVKRIVTESSPHLFLTCSEDGEVRQWDLRQPSSAYPRPPGRRVWRSNVEDDDPSPPPLISYKRWHMDINTISCSPTRPHYIALGGAHLHCFLHDRRMLGRDRGSERASFRSSTNNMTDRDDNFMGEATQCVKRFAPNGQRRMKRTDNGHITSCKISDANPDEMIVSWSGEWIYNFNLLHTPDAREANNRPRSSIVREHGSGRVTHLNDRKRKRTRPSPPVSPDGVGRATSKARRTPLLEPHASDEVALRVRYENGQSESIPIRNNQAMGDTISGSAAASMTIPQQRSYRLANTSVKLRKHMFGLEDPKPVRDSDPTGHSSSFTSVIGLSASMLDEMDDIIRTWRYPVDPDDFEVAFQKTLRQRRESARRFIQASGTVARVLGGNIQTAGDSGTRVLDTFSRIVPAPNEVTLQGSSEQFNYDFLKAICLWLDSGPGALVEGFTRQAGRARNQARFPIPEGAGIEAIDEFLLPYLLELSGVRSIPDVNTSRFEVDANQMVFDSEMAAVLAFASAVKIPFHDLSSATGLNPPGSTSSSVMELMSGQDRKTALKFWAFKVARGVLLNAGEGVNHAFIDRAFGGLGQSNAQVRLDERLLDQQFERIDPDEEDPAVESIQLNRSNVVSEENEIVDQESSENGSTEYFGNDVVMMEATRAAEAGNVAFDSEVDAEENDADNDEVGEDEDENEDDEDADADSREDHDEDSDDDDDDEEQMGGFLYRSSFERTQIREQVHADVPCGTHTRYYRGHCNVKVSQIST